MKNRILLIIALLISTISFAQPSQTVRGKIYDSETNYQVIGAKITLLSSDSLKKFQAITNEEGAFKIENVPVGKYQLTIFYPTYDLKTITLEVNSGKEAIANVPLSERVRDWETDRKSVV